jgi:outer membrane cobalamin receptor
MNGIFNFDEQLLINANLNLEKYDVYQSFDFLPEINLVYTFNELLKISADSSYTVRYPDFTELYYEDEYDLGNPGLKPERSYEERLGFDSRLGILTLKDSLFYRFNFDAIDWAAGMVTYMDGITRNGWLVENIGKINTAGDTVGILADLGNMKFSTDFTYLDSYESERYQSKYGITYLKDKLVMAAIFNVFGTDIKLDYTYKKYINRSDLYNNFDCILAKKILEWLEISLKVEDILNAYYEEVIGIPATGRMITLRADINY